MVAAKAIRIPPAVTVGNPTVAIHTGRMITIVQMTTARMIPTAQTTIVQTIRTARMSRMATAIAGMSVDAMVKAAPRTAVQAAPMGRTAVTAVRDSMGIAMVTTPATSTMTVAISTVTTTATSTRTEPNTPATVVRSIVTTDMTIIAILHVTTLVATRTAAVTVAISTVTTGPEAIAVTVITIRMIMTPVSAVAAIVMMAGPNVAMTGETGIRVDVPVARVTIVSAKAEIDTDLTVISTAMIAVEGTAATAIMIPVTAVGRAVTMAGAAVVLAAHAVTTGPEAADMMAGIVKDPAVTDATVTVPNDARSFLTPHAAILTAPCPSPHRIPIRTVVPTNRECRAAWNGRCYPRTRRNA